MSQLVDLAQPKGLVSKGGRYIAADKWAGEIKNLKDTVNQAMTRWQARPFISCVSSDDLTVSDELAHRSPARSTS